MTVVAQKSKTISKNIANANIVYSQEHIDPEVQIELTKSGYPRQFFRPLPHALINAYRRATNKTTIDDSLTKNEYRVFEYIKSRTIDKQREGFIDFTSCFVSGQRDNPFDKGTGIARTSVYPALKRLQELGYIHTIERGIIRLTWVNLTFTGNLETNFDDAPERYRKESEYLNPQFWVDLFTQYKFDRRISTETHFKFLENMTPSAAGKLMEIDKLLRKMKQKKGMDDAFQKSYEEMGHYDLYDPEYHDQVKSEDSDSETNYKDATDTDVGDIAESVEKPEPEPKLFDEMQDENGFDSLDKDQLCVDPIYGDVLTVAEQEERWAEMKEAYDNDEGNERRKYKRNRKAQAQSRFFKEIKYADFREGRSTIKDQQNVSLYAVETCVLDSCAVYITLDDSLMLLNGTKGKARINHFSDVESLFNMTSRTIDPTSGKSLPFLLKKKYPHIFAGYSL